MVLLLPLAANGCSVSRGPQPGVRGYTPADRPGDLVSARDRSRLQALDTDRIRVGPPRFAVSVQFCARLSARYDCPTDRPASPGTRMVEPKSPRLQNRGLQVRVLPALSSRFEAGTGFRRCHDDSNPDRFRRVA